MCIRRVCAYPSLLPSIAVLSPRVTTASRSALLLPPCRPYCRSHPKPYTPQCHLQCHWGDNYSANKAHHTVEYHQSIKRPSLQGCRFWAVVMGAMLGQDRRPRPSPAWTWRGCCKLSIGAMLRTSIFALFSECSPPAPKHIDCCAPVKLLGRVSRAYDLVLSPTTPSSEEHPPSCGGPATIPCSEPPTRPC